MTDAKYQITTTTSLHIHHQNYHCASLPSVITYKMHKFKYTHIFMKQGNLLCNFYIPSPYYAYLVWNPFTRWRTTITNIHYIQCVTDNKQNNTNKQKANKSKVVTTDGKN